jgi:hypothetical protein
MRLIKPNNGSWKALFTVAWEVEHLAEAGDQWVPFALPKTREPVGQIHAINYEIRLAPGVTLSTRQVVTLLPEKVM